MARRQQLVIADGVTSGFPVITDNGNYPAAAGFVDWQGGQGVLMARGAFDSGTAKLQMQAPDGSTWVDVTPTISLTAAGMTIVFNAPAGRMRLNVASVAAAAAGISAWLIGIPSNLGG